MQIYVPFSLLVFILLADKTHCRAASKPDSEEDSAFQQELKDVEYSNEQIPASSHESSSLSKPNKDKSDENASTFSSYEDATFSYINPEEDANPRVITDPEIIYGYHGAPIQYWYNETNHGKKLGDPWSAPGCPKSINGIPWIHYGNRPRCHLAWITGPCQLGEKLIPKQNSFSGICGCECLTDVENIHLLKQHSGRYFFCKGANSEAAPDGQIYDKDERKCYPAFKLDVGACPKEQVISNWTDSSITCLPFCDPAASNNDWLKEKGLCTTTPEQAVVAVNFLHGIELHDDCKEIQIYSTVLNSCISSSKSQIILP